MEELVAIAAVVAVIQKIYSTYQSLYNFLADPASPEDVIIADLQQLGQQLTAIQDAITALQGYVRVLIQFAEIEAFEQVLTAVENQRGIADTAAEEFAQWLQGGKTDAFTLANAKDHSLSAANTMRDSTAFFQLPGLNSQSGSAQDNFDYRIALPQYVYILAIRLTVIFGTEPAWKSDAIILAELKSHSDRLSAIISQIASGIQFHSGKTVDPAGYTIGADSIDTISGYTTQVFQDSGPGDDAVADAILARIEHWQIAEVRNAIGLTVVMQLQDTVQWYAAGAPLGRSWTPWIQVAPSIGPDNSNFDFPGESFPLAAVSPVAGSLSLFWVGYDGTIYGRSWNDRAAPEWADVFTVPGAATTGGGEYDPLGSTALTATSCDADNITLIFMASDGSIKITYYDSRATQPAWASPFVVATPELGLGLVPSLNAAISTGPGAITVLYTASSGLMSTSCTLTVQTTGSGATETRVVEASVPTAPVRVPEAGAAGGFAALSTGPGSLSLFWNADSGIKSTYYDERNFIQGWATPFWVVQTGVEPSAGLAAVSPTPYTADVFWFNQTNFDAAPTNAIYTSSYGLWASTQHFGTMVVHFVYPSAPAVPAEVVTQSWDGGNSLLAATNGGQANGTSILWLADDLSIRTTNRAAIGASWISPETIGAPIGDILSPIVPVTVGTDDIWAFTHLADGTIYGTRRIVIHIPRPPRPPWPPRPPRPLLRRQAP